MRCGWDWICPGIDRGAPLSICRFLAPELQEGQEE